MGSLTVDVESAGAPASLRRRGRQACHTHLGCASGSLNKVLTKVAKKAITTIATFYQVPSILSRHGVCPVVRIEKVHAPHGILKGLLFVLLRLPGVVG